MISNKIQLQFILVLLAGAVVLSFFILKPFLAPLVLAMVFSVVLRPLYAGILARLGRREGLAALLAVVASVVCIVLPLTVLGTQIFNEARGLYDSRAEGNAAEMVAAATESLVRFVSGFSPSLGERVGELSAGIDAYAVQGLEWLMTHVGRILSGVAGVALDLFVFFVALYYLLRDGPKLKRLIVDLSPLEDAEDEMVFGKLTAAINSVIKGNLTIGLVQGVLTAVGLALFGVPNPVLWGTIAAVAALIPGFGTSLVVLPSIAYLFFTGETGAAAGLLVWGILAVGLVDNFLGPRLIGRGAKLHPLLVLLSVLGGLAFFGPIGLFIGPLAVSLLLALLEIYSYLAGQLKGEHAALS